MTAERREGGQESGRGRARGKERIEESEEGNTMLPRSEVLRSELLLVFPIGHPAVLPLHFTVAFGPRKLAIDEEDEKIADRLEVIATGRL